MKESLTQLHTEPASAEREWTVEEIPVLSASVSLPEPVPAADRLSRRIRHLHTVQIRVGGNEHSQDRHRFLPLKKQAVQDPVGRVVTA